LRFAKQDLACILAALARLAFCGPSAAQNYPARSIKIIVALAPGGGGDVFARTLAEELRVALSVTVVVENKPGGNETIGARACAESPPDGYTLCVLSSEVMVYNQFLYKNPFNAAKDLQPIIGLFLNTFALAASSSINVKTVPELVALSKSKPNTLSYGTFSFPLSRFMEKLKDRTGADIVRVPFRGGGELVNAMLSGSTAVGLLGLSNMMAQIEGGLITVLAVNSKRRSAAFPDRPTFLEVDSSQEYPGAWFGLFAPNGLPKAIVQKLGDETARILVEEKFSKKMFLPRGVEPVDSRDEAFVNFINQDRKAAERIVKESGYQPQ
jgi:tripartite-type tricarboxylate transporter receptor subunit TctC